MKMKKPFEVGERVAVYGHRALAFGVRVVGLIEAMDQDERRMYPTGVKVRDEKYSGQAYFAHPKQCRRLVKKERRRAWLSARALRDFPGRRITADLGGPGWDDSIEFIEVRKGK